MFYLVRKETRCRHIGYSYRLTARVLLYAPSHRQDNTYHGLCYTSRGALAGTSVLKRKVLQGTGFVEEHGGNVCVFCRERDYELLDLWKSMVVMLVCFVENETTSYWICGRAWW